MNKLYLTLGLICLFTAPVISQTSTDIKEVEKKTSAVEKNAEVQGPSVISPILETPGKEIESPSKNNHHKMPADFPQFIDTGNPAADAADYKARKLQWINDNPTKYAEHKSKTTLPSAPRSLPLVPETKSK